MSISPLTIQDSFSRSLSGSLGTTDSGHTWVTNTPHVSVSSGTAVLNSNANGDRYFTRLNVPVVQSAASVLTKVRITSNAQWPLTDFGPTLLHNSTNTMYGLTIQSNYSEIAIIVFINGRRYEMNRKSFPILKDTNYWVRFRVTTTGVYGKVWEDGTHEPSSWTISSLLWDGGNPPTAGHAGFFVQGTRDTYQARVESYYYYTDDELGAGHYAVDTFNGRTVHAGFGYSSSGHTWEGSVADDPAITGKKSIGSVSSNFASVSITDTASYFGFLGKSRTEDVEAYAQVGFVSNYAGSGTFRLGIRGEMHMGAGVPHAVGYAVQLATGADRIRIVKRTNIASGWTVLSASGPGEIINDSAVWRTRVQIVGNTIKARYWKTTDDEPTTWQVTATDSSIQSGKLWVGFSQSQDVARSFNLYEIEYKDPTLGVEVPLNHTKTAVPSVLPQSDTAIALWSYFDNDINENNNAILRYKPTTVSSWITFGPMVRSSFLGSEMYIAEVFGLQPDTDYNFEITYQDPDGVYGANPVYVVGSTEDRGISAKDISVTNVTSTTIGVEATYTRDSDNDSSATVEARRASNTVDVVNDYFVDEREGTYLQNTESVHGGAWQKHPSMTADVHAIRSRQAFYVNTETDEDFVLYTHSALSPISTYNVEASFVGRDLQGQTGIAIRVHESQRTFYGFGINSGERVWEYFRMVNGAKTVLHTAPFDGDLDQFYTLKIISRSADRSVYVNDTLVFVDTDSLIAETYRFGYYSTGISHGTASNQFAFNHFIAQYRTALEGFVSHGFMDVNRTTKTFSKTLIDLLPDTVYEIRVIFSDADTAENEVRMVTAVTTGSAIQLMSMGATPNPTSAIIDVFYDYDSNNNSTLSLQYKSTRDYLWTTLPSDRVRANRIVKKFSTTLTALRPSTTYEVRVVATDPDGLIEGSPASLVGLFTTSGFTIEDKRQSKHYLWKVYDPDGEYICTLPDPPTPEYSMYQNGGVTDLSFTLYRRMSDYNTSRMIQYQNIIDVWAIDPSSDGMGPNLIADPDCDPEVGAWVIDGTTYGQNARYLERGGPDDSSSLVLDATEEQYETSSNPIEAVEGMPLVISCIAKARGAKLRMYARAYDANDVAIDSSDEIAETISTDWQKLRIEYIPPKNTAYIRILLRNTGRGWMRADKFSVLSKEMLVYRGRIESYRPKITTEGETVEVEVLGLASLLSDDYIEFLQFVEVQPQNDVLAGRINYGAADPADMFKRVIDEARRVNPFFQLYYTSESIRYTGNLMQYTFRDQQIRACLDKARTLCPSGWYYMIAADGLVTLRGPDTSPTHVLRIGIEITEFEVEKSIRNLKNYIRVKGRQDEDMSEADGHGSINYIAFDQKSMDEYGKRTLFVRDAQLVDPESAKIVGDGRLDEHNREEQAAQCTVPDEKSEMASDGPLKGYNIEALQAGDNVIIVDPLTGPRNTYWDQFSWDEESWDIANVYMPLPESVPIKTVKFRGDYVELELSERPPSAVGDFSKFYRWMANKDRED